MRKKKTILMLLLLAACLSVFGCGKNAWKKENDIKEFTAFIAVQGKEIPEDNRMMNRIAEKTGAKAAIRFLTGQTALEKIESMIQQESYPDFLDGGDATLQLLEAGAYIPLDEYLDDYPNLKNYLSKGQWNQMRREDGHIYFIPQFGIVRGEDMNMLHSGEAFWIQKRVLAWAGYPQIHTLDEYFGLIEAYMEANPVNDDGTKNTGFQILCDDWRYFCLENPPQFLAGYPNDGCAIVDPVTQKASVYDTIPEAKQYYQKLNEVYNKGLIESDTFLMSYDQYMEKISTGTVLGMVDQYWEFMGASDILYGKGMDDRTYVPLGIVANDGITDAYRSSSALNTGNGIGISVDCQDVEGALQFLNDLLDKDVQIMRTWGEEGVDYEVNDDGIFYRTEEQRANASDQEWINRNLCSYYYFPHYEGMAEDGKNALEPDQQPDEYYETLGEVDREILDAYGYEKWTDFLTPVKENPPWFALYTAENNWAEDTDYGKAKQKMEEVKRKWLPQVIMVSKEEFEQTWDAYMDEYYREVDVDAYEAELTREVQRRVALSQTEP